MHCSMKQLAERSMVTRVSSTIDPILYLVHSFFFWCPFLHSFNQTDKFMTSDQVHYFEVHCK